MHGYDIDSDAFEGPYESLVQENGAGDQFQERDFLKATPVDLGGRKFNVVIGNPPYVSYHNMEEAQRKAAVQAIRGSGFSLERQASGPTLFYTPSDSSQKEVVLRGSFRGVSFMPTIHRRSSMRSQGTLRKQ